jgi:LacI family transcriptional regulator
MTTMREVAAIAAVSAKTVSRVFNGDRHVRPETRARVESALKRLGYVPNGVATTFRTGRAPVIGIAVPDILDPFFAAIVSAVDRLASEDGMSVVVSNLGTDAEREHVIVESALRRSLSGLIIAPISTDHRYLAAWTRRTPVVFVDRLPVGLAADSFIEDDHAGAYAATTHLIDHGHRRIAFFGDSLDLPTTRNRLTGYRNALADAGLAEDDLIVLEVWDRESARLAVGELLERPEPPTALFSSNARCTMAAVPALGHAPLAVVSFGDFPMADVLRPSVTVIDQDPERLGTLAARRVLDRLETPHRRFRRRTVLPVKLVERDSCRSVQ